MEVKSFSKWPPFRKRKMCSSVLGKFYLLFLSGCTGSRSVYCDLPLRLSRRIQSRIQLCRVHKLRHSALDRLRQAGSISKCEDVLILNLLTLTNPRSFCSLFAWAANHASAIVSIHICIGRKLSALSS